MTESQTPKVIRSQPGSIPCNPVILLSPLALCSQTDASLCDELGVQYPHFSSAWREDSPARLILEDTSETAQYNGYSLLRNVHKQYPVFLK